MKPEVTSPAQTDTTSVPTTPAAEPVQVAAPAPTPQTPAPVAQPNPMASTPFFETKAGIWLKANLVDFLSVSLLSLGFLVMLLPLFYGENIFYYLGTAKMAWLWLFMLVYLGLLGLYAVHFLNVMPKYPRVLSVLFTTFYGFVFGTLMSMFSFSMAGRSTVEFWFYVLLLLVIASYLLNVFKKQAETMIKI
jgi:hypothetical protein